MAARSLNPGLSHAVWLTTTNWVGGVVGVAGDDIDLNGSTVDRTTDFGAGAWHILDSVGTGKIYLNSSARFVGDITLDAGVFVYNNSSNSSGTFINNSEFQVPVSIAMQINGSSAYFTNNATITLDGKMEATNGGAIDNLSTVNISVGGSLFGDLDSYIHRRFFSSINAPAGSTLYLTGGTVEQEVFDAIDPQCNFSYMDTQFGPVPDVADVRLTVPVAASTGTYDPGRGSRGRMVNAA